MLKLTMAVQITTWPKIFFKCILHVDVELLWKRKISSLVEKTTVLPCSIYSKVWLHNRTTYP